ncbi:armadillo-type protein [Limtongia smithiae]|uniref:armadillo-type protein n=1 Tax=Limtongia smithiae TaxID=1125753 RepID=UPI0034CDF5B0
MAEQEEDFSALPLVDRAVHKMWKVRLAAYEEMTRTFTVSASENDPCFRPFLNDPALYKKVVTDSNVAAQEAGITSLVAFLQYGGVNACQRIRGTVVAPLAEKGLVSMRAGTKQKTIEALLFFIELDLPDPVVEELIPILSHKLPKLVSGTTMALREIVHAFGTKTVSPKPILKALPKLFAHTDKNVRAEATQLSVELYKWMGDALKSILLPDLKPVQQKELEEGFEAVKGVTVQQERYLISQQAAAAAASGSLSSCGPAVIEEEIDPYDLVDTVDISGKIPTDFFELMGSTKWKERKDAVDELFKVVSAPKIADSNFNDLMRVLAKCIMKDANVAVVSVAANCVEAMAKGMRTSFVSYVPIILTSLLDRLKEKKQTVLTALNGALDGVFESTTFGGILEDILEFLKHKNPQVKQETANFVARCLRTVKFIPKPAEIKQIAESHIALLADTAQPVRAAAAEVLGTLMKMIGERAMNPYIDLLDDIRKNMIKEYYENATVRAKQPEKAAALPPQAALAAKAAPRSSTTGATIRPRPTGSAVKRPSGTPPTSSSRSSASDSAAISSTSSAVHSRLAPTGVRPRVNALASGSLRQRAEDAAHSPRASATPPRAIPSGRGLTGVSLSSGVSSSSVHSSLSAADRAELAELRRAKEEWVTTTSALKRQVETLQAENSKITQTITELQLNNKQLIEDHTRDVLAIKAKETQLARARTEIDNSRAQAVKLQKEIEIAKSERVLTGVQQTRFTDEANGHDLKDYSTNILATPARKPSAYTVEEEKENTFGQSNGLSRRESMYSTHSTHHGYSASTMAAEPAGSPTSLSKHADIDSGLATSNAGSAESWRRAAEVTSQLKARIEAMKARQSQIRR